MSGIAQLSGNPGSRPLIKEIEIKNFRCYSEVKIDKCSRVNIVVGDNGVGKTALLEAVFLALGSSPEIGVRFRGLRGLDANLSGSSTLLENALYRDLFYNGDMARTIQIGLHAKGPAKRSVTVRRNVAETRLLSVDPRTNVIGLGTQESTGGLKFSWTNDQGKKFELRASVSNNGILVQPLRPGEQLEIPEERFYYLASGLSVGSAETATRFSELEIAGEVAEVLSVFRSEFSWIEDLSVQMNGGSGMMYATVNEPFRAMRPLGYISGGINKIINILLCVAAAKDGVVLIDEIENGIHHRHHAAMWRMLFSLAERSNVQLIMSTHSAEWLEAILEVDPKFHKELSLWRVERDGKEVTVQQFSGTQAVVAIEEGSEVR